MRIFILILGLLAPISWAHAQENEETNIDDSVLNQTREEPIAYDPFPMVDPNTGEAVSADQMIDTPNGSMKAGEYYDTLNRYQAHLNAQGKTLKGHEDDIGPVVEVLWQLERLESQKEDQQGKNKERDEKLTDEPMSIDRAWDELTEEGAETLKSEIAKLYRKYLDTADGGERISSPAPDPRVSVEAREHLHSLVHKEWDLALGEDEKIGVVAKAQLSMEASLKRLKGIAEAVATAKFFGKEKELIRATAKGERAYASDSAALIGFYVAGKKIYEKDWEKPALKMFSKDGIEPSVMTYRQAKKYRTMVGPVPVSLAVGGAGEVGYDWAVGVEDLDAKLHAVGWCSIDAFIEAAADAVILSIGAGGELTLFRDELNLTLGAKLDPSEENDTPELKTMVKATNKMTVLAGSLYAFVDAEVPTLSVPPWETKRWTFDLYNWEGVSTGGEKVLFHIGEEVTPEGVAVTGAPTLADIRALDVDRNLEEAFRSFVVDIDGEGDVVLTEANRLIGTADAINGDIEAWISSLSTN